MLKHRQRMRELFCGSTKPPDDNFAKPNERQCIPYLLISVFVNLVLVFVFLAKLLALSYGMFRMLSLFCCSAAHHQLAS